MNDKIGEYQEFSREESFHYYEWENVHPSKNKAAWLREIAQQEKSSRYSASEHTRFSSFVDDLKEREYLPLTTRALNSLRSFAVGSLVAVMDKFS